jgi:RND family efflux transporter MFP subunit
MIAIEKIPTVIGEYARHQRRVAVQRLPGLPSLLAACVVLLGCTQRQPQAVSIKPPEVLVGTPVMRTVTDFENFTGRLEAKKMVLVRARVSGYLDKVCFKEGAEVRKDEVLFVIDPRPYQAAFDRAQANVDQARARLSRLDLDLNRAKKLLPGNSISQEEFDKTFDDQAEAQAALKLAEADFALADLNLKFTQVRSPVDGKISRQMIDPGNMVKADETALTTVVSLDPIYAYFDVDERTHLRVVRLIRQGKVRSAQEQETSEGSQKVLLGLSDEEGFPHEGTVDFVDNQLDAMTGTLRLRAVFENSKRLFAPGLFARIQVPIGDAHRAILISERALGSDQGEKFLYVVNEKNEVAYRHVQVGALNQGLRVIESGLAAGEKVVLSGLQRIKAGVTVQPKDIDMTAAEEPSAAPAPTVVAGPAAVPAPAATVTAGAMAAPTAAKVDAPVIATSTSRPAPRVPAKPATGSVPSGGTRQNVQPDSASLDRAVPRISSPQSLR